MIESLSTRRIALELVLVSFVVLFQELTLIRWMAGQVRVLAYFPNLVLLSAFLGLGIGCLLAGRRSLLWAWPASLALVVGSTIGMGRVVFTEEVTSDHLWMLYYDLEAVAPVVNSIKLPIMVSFVLGAVSFIALGQMVAVRIQALRVRWSALWGYSFDIMGSLAGVVAFTLLGFSGAFPVHWFAVVLVAGGWLFLGSARRLVAYTVVAAALIVGVALGERSSAYSPYYALTLGRDSTSAVKVLANGSLHQVGLDLARNSVPRMDYDRVVLEGYHAPYRLLDRPPRRVLVLGAGTGNDVATLLDEGAEEVDVVEIDPVILDWGRSYHPNRPYDSPKVRLFNTDARSFLHRTDRTYDLIVFGTLDSMTRLSALSSVRLDNFVYTLESVHAARARLTADGGMMLFFMVGREYIDARLTALLSEAFGEPPLVYRKHHNLFNRVYLAGPLFAGLARAREPAPDGPRIPTDDWPYLYLRERGVSGFYLAIIGAIALVSIGGVFAASRHLRTSLARGGGIDAEMFLFGMAFLLLETRAVTEMNLVWGATWITSAVVFGSILSMVLLATILMQWRPLPFSLCAAGLVTALLLAWLFPIGVLLAGSPAVRLALSVLVVGGPIFFASACFARLFVERRAVDVAFGWNLLGAVAGGLLEFASMWSGLKALLLVALGGYLLAFAIRARSRR